MSFEKVYRMKDAHKRIERSEENVHPVTEEEIELGEHDRSLSDILQDKREQDMFVNKFCYNRNAEKTSEVIKSLASNTQLTDKQNQFLEQMRGEYNLRRAEVEQVWDMMTPEHIQRVADMDPRIAQVIGQIGMDKAIGLFDREFELLALSDARTFKRLVKEMRGVHSIESNEIPDNLDRKVSESLLKYGIKEEDYWNATRGGMSANTKDGLDKLVYEQFGLFKKGLDMVTKGALSHRGGRALYQNFQEQSQIIAECDKHMAVIGRILRGTLNANVRMAIQKAMVEGGDVKEKKTEDNVATIQDYQDITNKFGPGTRQRRWEQYKESECKKSGIKDISKQPDALDAIKDSFAKKEFNDLTREQGRYKASGVLGALLAFLFNIKNADEIKKSLT